MTCQRSPPGRSAGSLGSCSTHPVSPPEGRAQADRREWLLSLTQADPAPLFQGPCSPGPEPRFSSSLPPGETSRGWFPAEGRAGPAPIAPPTPGPHTLHSARVAPTAVKRPAPNSQFTAAWGLMNYARAQINPSAPCQGGIKGPGGQLTVSAQGGAETGFQGPWWAVRKSPLLVLGEPWALCSPPLPGALALFLCQARV